MLCSIFAIVRNEIYCVVAYSYRSSPTVLSSYSRSMKPTINIEIVDSCMVIMYVQAKTVVTIKTYHRQLFIPKYIAL